MPKTNNKLKWHKWTKAKDCPTNELLLVELDKEYEQYQTVTFRHTAYNKPYGTITSSFYFEHAIIRYASIQYLIE